MSDPAETSSIGGRLILGNEALAKERAHSLMGGPQISERLDLVVERASGSEVFDSDGRRFIDLYTGVGSAILGHAHPRISEAVAVQMSRYSGGLLPIKSRGEYLSLLASQLDPRLSGIRLFSTGSEAVEAAVALARAATQRRVIVSFWGGFHGKTHLSAALGTGSPRAVSRVCGDVIKVPFAACHACPFGLVPATCEFECVRFAERSAHENAIGDVAAVLVEPIQGTAGNVVPPAGYLAELRGLADRLGALLVVDEVISGFGRTGRMFAHHSKSPSGAAVVPDILILGKGMGNGVPVSAVVASQDLSRAASMAHPGAGSTTFGGNPLSTVAALATLNAVIEEDIIGNVRRSSDLVHEWTQDLENSIDIVSRAQHDGLMIGLDLSLPDSRVPLPANLVDALFRELVTRGVIAMAYSGVIRLYPALNISRPLLSEALEKIREALEAVSSAWKYERTKSLEGRGGTH